MVALVKTILKYVIFFYVVVVGIQFWVTYTLVGVTPDGAQMEPTIQPSTTYFLNRFKTSRESLEPGKDIVHFYSPLKTPDGRGDDKDRRLARVMALPGQTVRFENRKFFVNGVEQPFADLASGAEKVYTLGDTLVPRGHVFLLVDAAGKDKLPQDGRTLGMIPLTAVVGAVGGPSTMTIGILTLAGIAAVLLYFFVEKIIK